MKPRIPRTREQAARLLERFDAGELRTRVELSSFFHRIAVAASRGQPVARRALALLLLERRRIKRIGVN